MARLRHHHDPPKHNYDDLTLHCHRFFERPCDDWNYESFASHFMTLGALEFSVLNHKWMKALGRIESSSKMTSAQRRKARSLMDRTKAASVFDTPPPPLIDHSALQRWDRLSLSGFGFSLALPALVPQG